MRFGARNYGKHLINITMCVPWTALINQAFLISILLMMQQQIGGLIKDMSWGVKDTAQ
jgi:hypothetical protein